MVYETVHETLLNETANTIYFGLKESLGIIILYGCLPYDRKVQLFSKMNPNLCLLKTCIP